MKFFAIAAVLVSFSANAACPNLEGVYATCTSSNGEVSYGQTITQSVSNGVTSYTTTSIDEETGEEVQDIIKTDGVAYISTQTIEGTDLVLTLNSQATCVNNTIAVKIQASVGSEEFAKLNMTISKSGDELKIVTLGHANGESVNETQVCR